MTYYLESLVWMNEGDAELSKLGIDQKEKLVKRKVTLDIFDIQHFYPTTMINKGDGVMITFKNEDIIVLAVTYEYFSRIFFEALDEIK